ncbi:Alpha-L-fucosidase [Dictyocaulus viviparus]|uniref:alpha-L-fucosidase n=1 Tax=Dictyocaulus viviparus TaxID=29172 RepID=A0A0D8XP45_DICVI|nr:Alpha-L-fucosidase [Dictyocaulus viviparus]
MPTIATILIFHLIAVINAKYQPTWSSLDARPLPQWYDEAKFGIFCHWGVYSVPAFRSEWLWWYWKGDNPDKNVLAYMNSNYKPGTTYADFARDQQTLEYTQNSGIIYQCCITFIKLNSTCVFTAELFDAKEFVDIVTSSGAKYFVFTSKHHEGFTMWPTRTSWNWNSFDVGPKRDIVGELKEAFKVTDVHFGLYYSLFEWFHPMFLNDGKYNTTTYVDVITTFFFKFYKRQLFILTNTRMCLSHN